MRLPVGVRTSCIQGSLSISSWRFVIFFFTLYIYATFHASRKPISVVKPILHPNCTDIAQKENKSITPENATFCMWKPFDVNNSNVIFGYLDLAYLLAYAVGMFLSGHIAERMNLRIFLTWGCILSGLTTAAFGIAYFADIHSLWFFFLVQTLAGLVQSSGWPAVVTCMGNWFGKSKRGLILGCWNSHVSLGNIMGGVIAGIFVDYAWGWSFFVPGAIVAFSGILAYLFLVPYPEDLGFPPTDAVLKIEDETVEPPSEQQQSQSIWQPLGDATEQEPFEPPPSEGTSDDAAVLPEVQRPSHIEPHEDIQAISFCGALAIPGVVEYSLCLFFVKSTAYIFLFWLPKYLKEANNFDPALAADVSAVFDVGGILGGIVAGFIADQFLCCATICVSLIGLGMPALGTYFLVGSHSEGVCISMLVVLGFLIVGPYSLITTAVSADLGTHQSLRGNAKALATVVSIIDGTGSLGAAIGPCLVGLLIDYGWVYVFVMLITFLGISVLFLLRRVIKELRRCCRPSGGYVLLT
ncbi:hypothetical protein Aperf_G00000108316 [Anoplocephala perfoliata]